MSRTWLILVKSDWGISFQGGWQTISVCSDNKPEVIEEKEKGIWELKLTYDKGKPLKAHLFSDMKPRVVAEHIRRKRMIILKLC